MIQILNIYLYTIKVNLKKKIFYIFDAIAVSNIVIVITNSWDVIKSITVHV